MDKVHMLEAVHKSDTYCLLISLLAKINKEITITFMQKKVN